MAWKGNRRLNARRDANEPAIIDALREQGFHVVQLNDPGVPDLLVSKRSALHSASGEWLGSWGHCWLVEVKQLKATHKPSQLAFRESWQGPPIITLRSIEDAMRFQLLACETP